MERNTQYTALADEWMAHCERVEWSSSFEDRLHHPSFRALVAFGLPVVPYIIERYKQDGNPLWFAVLERIPGSESAYPASFDPPGLSASTAWLVSSSRRARDEPSDDGPALDQDIGAQFEPIADEWRAQCNEVGWSSSPDDRLYHPLYHALVGFGPPAVPHIIERYESDAFPWWGFLLDDITGVAGGRHHARSSPNERQRFWITWWERTQEQSRAFRKAYRERDTTRDQDIGAQIDAWAQEWLEHLESVCWSSCYEDYLRHSSYQNMVALGVAAVPPIMRWYEREPQRWWGFLLEDITGIRSMDRNAFAPSLVRAFWLAWWKQMRRE